MGMMNTHDKPTTYRRKKPVPKVIQSQSRLARVEDTTADKHKQAGGKVGGECSKNMSTICQLAVCIYGFDTRGVNALCFNEDVVTRHIMGLGQFFMVTDSRNS